VLSGKSERYRMGQNRTLETEGCYEEQREKLGLILRCKATQGLEVSDFGKEITWMSKRIYAVRGQYNEIIMWLRRQDENEMELVFSFSWAPRLSPPLSERSS
jgi:hypothetical protein